MARGNNMQDTFDNEFMPVIKHHYPELAEEGWHVECVGIELDELDDDETVIKCRPPKNWIFVRLVNENQTKPVLLIIPTLSCPTTYVEKK